MAQAGCQTWGRLRGLSHRPRLLWGPQDGVSRELTLQTEKQPLGFDVRGARAVPLSPGCETHRGEAGEAFRTSSFSLKAADGGLDV